MFYIYIYTQIDKFSDLIFFKCLIFKNGGFSRVIRGLSKIRVENIEIQIFLIFFCNMKNNNKLV